MSEGLPWKEFVNANSENLQAQGLKLVIYPSDSSKSTWKVQSISIAKDDPFTSLCPAPEELAGLRERELEEILGVVCENYDAVFVHPKRFIGGMDNYDNVIALARYWVK